jgi:hypothetical protein
VEEESAKVKLEDGRPEENRGGRKEEVLDNFDLNETAETFFQIVVTFPDNYTFV